MTVTIDKPITESVSTPTDTRIFSELVKMVENEVEKLRAYINTVYKTKWERDLSIRFVRERLSKRVTAEVVPFFLEDPIIEKKRDFYYLVDRYGLICGTVKANGIPQKNDSITLERGTVECIRNIAKREILEGLRKGFNDLLLDKESEWK